MNDKLLNIAMEEAKKGILAGDGGPFGAVIVDRDGNIISTGHNMVLSKNDPTAHAEITAIRSACQKRNSHDLSDCILYSSCEPCPMCLSAIIWSNISKVYYSSTRKDAASIGFKDDAIYEYLSGNNNILEKERIENKECDEVLKNYDKELY